MSRIAAVRPAGELAAPALAAGRPKRILDAVTMRIGPWLRSERSAFAALLLLAAAVRLPGLGVRGRFDLDQGLDMLVLMRVVNEGELPLLGPKASVGEFHQGALYYLLLAPLAAVSNLDPQVLILAMAVLGIATIGLTWWLARSIGGPAAGLVAAGLVGLSPTAIEMSTFLWSANPIPFFAALALAAAWHARMSGRARWWILALGAGGAVWQLHLLGVLLLVPIGGLLAATYRHARLAGDTERLARLRRASLAGAGVIGLLFVPLIVHELQSGLTETQLLAAYVAAGGDGASGSGLSILERLPVVALRVLSWPISGPLTGAPLAALLAAAVVVALAATSLMRGAPEQRAGARWLVGSVVFGAAALAVVAPALQHSVPALPNDHYHAFLLPAVAALVGVGAAVLARRVPLVAAALVLLVFAIAVVRWPPAVDSTGGWTAARESGERIVALTGGQPVALLGVPDFKPTAATAYPILRAGGSLVQPAAAHIVVVACDRVFEDLVGAACGGPAEDALAGQLHHAPLARRPVLIDRFDASGRISISIYRR